MARRQQVPVVLHENLQDDTPAALFFTCFKRLRRVKGTYHAYTVLQRHVV